MNYRRFSNMVWSAKNNGSKIAISTSDGEFLIIKKHKTIKYAGKDRVIDNYIEERLNIDSDYLENVIRKIYNYINENNLIIFKIW